MSKEKMVTGANHTWYRECYRVHLPPLTLLLQARMLGPREAELCSPGHTTWH